MKTALILVNIQNDYFTDGGTYVQKKGLSLFPKIKELFYLIQNMKDIFSRNFINFSMQKN